MLGHITQLYYDIADFRKPATTVQCVLDHCPFFLLKHLVRVTFLLSLEASMSFLRNFSTLDIQKVGSRLTRGPDRIGQVLRMNQQGVLTFLLDLVELDPLDNSI